MHEVESVSDRVEHHARAAEHARALADATSRRLAIALDGAGLIGNDDLPSPRLDARHVPRRLRGVRTLFNGLHHFRPNDAQAILQDAVAQGQPIAVFELLQRNWPTLLQALFLPISILIITPLVRPMTWSRLLLTYVIPVASLLMLWDGVVSVLRCYRPEELRAMAAELDGPTYRWEAGSYWRRGAPVTYIVGYPRSTGDSRSPSGDPG